MLQVDFSPWKRWLERKPQTPPASALHSQTYLTGSQTAQPSLPELQCRPPPHRGSMTYSAVAAAIPTPLLAAAGGGRAAEPSLIGRGAAAAMLAEVAFSAGATGSGCGCQVGTHRVVILPLARGWR